jgi:hypothetical protein
MADIGNVITEYRKRSTKLLDALNDVHDALAVLEGLGADDTARQAAVNAFYAEFPGYDLTKTDLFDSAARWRDLRTWLQTATNFVPLNKTRI